VDIPPPGITFYTEKQWAQSIMILKNAIANMRYRLRNDDYLKAVHKKGIEYYRDEIACFESTKRQRGVRCWEEWRLATLSQIIEEARVAAVPDIMYVPEEVISD
jgi:hypothetical protein